MRLHLILDVSPEDGGRPVNSEEILDVLEAEIEDHNLEVENRVYAVKVLGSGRTAGASIESQRLRRPPR